MTKSINVHSSSSSSTYDEAILMNWAYIQCHCWIPMHTITHTHTNPDTDISECIFLSPHKLNTHTHTCREGKQDSLFSLVECFILFTCCSLFSRSPSAPVRPHTNFKYCACVCECIWVCRRTNEQACKWSQRSERGSERLACDSNSKKKKGRNK